VDLSLDAVLDQVVSSFAVHPVVISVHEAHGDLDPFEFIVDWMSCV
jgi:hypothetical protein